MPPLDLPIEPERLYTPREAAELFRVDPKTVSRWARDGRIPALRTIGGHRRFLGADLLQALEQSQDHAPEPELPVDLE